MVEARCKTGLNGSEWQTKAVRAFEAADCSRAEALRRMVEAYAERMHANLPVHAWEMP